MAITMTKKGYAVVEPNHLSAPRNGQVYGQLPANADIEVLEQGTFVKYDYANGEVNFDGDGPWMMVFNEEKLYDERFQMHRDYAMKAADFYDGKMYPRVFVMHAGDIFTTNNVVAGSYSVGQVLTPGDEDGILAVGTGDLECTVVKETTMPDGQPGLKLQVTKA
jgi:hypothetical protein